MLEEKKRKKQIAKVNKPTKEAFLAGFWAGITVIGSMVLVLLIIFWL